VKPAPAFDCARCGRTIGKAATHYRTEDNRITCSRCLTKAAHASLFPDCPERWHDVLDHPGSSGTRAGIAHVLGLWP
jgi:DNA-directed RNA polymerase subunit RPC12/RpoP